MKDTNNTESDREKLFVSVDDQIPPSPTLDRPSRRSSDVIERTVKVMFSLISLLLLAIVCTYAVSNTFFEVSDGDKQGNAQVREGLEPLAENKIRDCRTAGCYNNFECVEIKVDQACFVQPCPSVVYECLPPAMLNDPADAMFSIQAAAQETGEINSDDSDSAGELTEGYFACVQQHGGKNSWKHPTQSCNTCRCSANGTVACTKMLCKPANLSFSDMISKAKAHESRTLTTSMMVVPAFKTNSDDSSENTSQLFTSVVIDIQA
ncbi:hypothetical protein LPJ73_002741 [Coemansia sp. RSA 2703]|nr:hypothetical protein LPJ73_002741 [Coemansia sp. RSA 2703]KAJ2374843.1 hypothetical protein IW150_002879 [Coemansia sp. RSA 2607]